MNSAGTESYRAKCGQGGTFRVPTILVFWMLELEPWRRAFSSTPWMPSLGFNILCLLWTLQVTKWKVQA